MGFDLKKGVPKIGSGIFIFMLIVLSIFSIFLIRNSSLTGKVIDETISDPSLVVNLTFDDQNNPWKDYSTLNHQFTPRGSVGWKDKTVCKWNGCADLNTDGGDYLDTSTKFSLSNGIATSVWVYITKTGVSHMYWQMGEGDGLTSYIQDSVYGINPHLAAANGEVTANAGDSKTTSKNSWTHYFIEYDKNRIVAWKNGEIVFNDSRNFGVLNYSVGEILKIGSGIYNINQQGYMDELLVYNRGNFTHQDVQTIYNKKRMGTPPTRDVYVKSIKYALPVDWNSPFNSLITGTNMPINITIANAGVTNSGSFTYAVALGGSNACAGVTSVNAQSEVNVVCNWMTAQGFHQGFVVLDTNNEIQEDNKGNNRQRIYIPFLNRPWFNFNLDEWNSIYSPYCLNPSNQIPYSACNGIKSFVADDFNNLWSGNDIDPRGKWGRSNAMSCLVNNYDKNNEQCKNAMDHLFGWGNRSIESYSNVQAIQELAHAMFIYDIMFPMIEEKDHELLSKEYYDICQHIATIIRPDLDNTSLIIGDNGKGFGSGMSAFCYGILGDYSGDPTIMQNVDQQYWKPNLVDELMDRENSYLKSFKNDSWAKYQEGWHYKYYSQFHLVENLYFEKKYNLNNLSDYQNALCSMGREMVTDTLDHTYNGQTLRNDGNRKYRGIQRGDSNSFFDFSMDSVLDWGVADFYGILCDDPGVKQSLLSLRISALDIGDKGSVYQEIYAYKLLRDQVSPQSPDKSFPKVMFDNANDILTIRSNYSYFNDTVIEIDGGEERGGGHSLAQGYYLYALGEPFLDFEQVPYNDDVRAETWKNGISLQNDVQAVEGQSGFYSSACGNAPLNQYYGMSTCTQSGVYPDFRDFPLQYGGDLENYVGTQDANLAGVFRWQPYKNANPVKEYYIKFGNLLAKRTTVSGVTQGNGIYHNFININDEFSESRTGLNFTLTRDNKNLKTQVVYSSQQDLSIGGGATNVNYCFAKTDCSGYTRGKGKYRRMYYYTAQNSLDLIFSQQWYYNNQYHSIKSISGTDKGLSQGSNVIIFDTSGDGKSVYDTKDASGWALAYNDDTGEIAAFNTTYIKAGSLTIFQSNLPVSAHLRRDNSKITLTINTMHRQNYIDFPRKVRVTIDAAELSQNSNLVVTKNGELVQIVSQSGTTVTFDAISGQNSDTYEIAGSGPDSTSPYINTITNEETTNQSSYIKAAANELINLSLAYGYSPSNLIYTAITGTYSRSPRVFFFDLAANSTIYYRTVVCDMSRNCVSNGTFSFKTLANNAVVASNKPAATKFNGMTTDFNNAANLDQVSNVVIEIKQYGRLFFSGNTNVSNANFDQYINMAQGSVTLDSRYLKAFNKSATVYMYSLPYSKVKILKDGIDCGSACTNLAYSSGNLSFSVQHFTTYSAAENSTQTEPETPPVDEQPANTDGTGGSSGGGGGGSGGSGAAIIPKNLSLQQGNATQNKETAPVNSAPILNLTNTSSEKIPEPEKPSAVKSSGTPFFLLLLPFFIVAGGIVVKHRGKKKHKPTIAEKISIITKQALKPLELPGIHAINTLYDLARHLTAMSEQEFVIVASSSIIPSWISESLSMPELANVVRYADSKEDMYRIIYNIYLKEFEPEKEMMLRISPDLLNISMNTAAKTPLGLKNGLLVYNLDSLLRSLSTISDDEFTAYYVTPEHHFIAEWGMQLGESIAKALQKTCTRYEMYKLLMKMKSDQELSRILNKAEETPALFTNSNTEQQISNNSIINNQNQQ